jgi:hypothetical protein
MTPAQLEHLKLIDAHLEHLLAIAEKRTPGEWEVDKAVTWDKAIAMQPCIFQRNAWTSDEDAAFIASCAGNAEAGWIQARGEIADLIAFNQNCCGWENDNGCAGAAIQYIQCRLAKILAAFPLKLIQKP